VHPLARNGTFLRLLVGRLVTNAGDSIYYVAALWLIHDLGGSTALTGVASFLFLVPGTLVFAVGPLVDRFSVRSVLVSTQAAQGLLILTIPVADAFGALSVGVVLVVIPLASLLNLVTYPAQSSALPRAVETEHLATANSVFNAAHESVNMAFNAVGGLLVGIAAVGAVGALLVDVGTFAVAILLFAGLTLPARRPREGTTDAETDGATEEGNSVLAALRREVRSYGGEFRDGISYLRGTAFLSVVVPQVVVSAAMGMLLAVLPAYAALQGGSGLYGVLLSAEAAGALVGAVLASRLGGVPYGRVLTLGSALTALAWGVAALTSWVPLIVGSFAVALVFPGANGVLFDTLVQSVAPEDYIGRVTSSMSTLSNVSTAIGSLAGGVLAAATGPVVILWVAAGANALVAAYFLASASIRSLPPVGGVSRGDDRIERFSTRSGE
jgi:MFS family permease